MTAWNIAAKDLYLLLRDRRTFAVLLLLPLVFIVIIGLTTGKLLGWRSTNQKLRIVAVDAIDYDAIGSSQFLATSTDEASGSQELSAAEREAERKTARHIVADVLNGIQTAPGIDVQMLSALRDELGVGEASDEQAAERLVAEGTVNAAPDLPARRVRKDLPSEPDRPRCPQQRRATSDREASRIGHRSRRRAPEIEHGVGDRCDRRLSSARRDRANPRVSF